jgi:hypothetical protein
LPKLDLQFQQIPPWPTNKIDLLKSEKNLIDDNFYTLFDIYKQPIKVKWKNDIQQFIIDGLSIEYKYSNTEIQKENLYFDPIAMSIKIIKENNNQFYFGKMVVNYFTGFNEIIVKVPQDWNIDATNLNANRYQNVELLNNKRQIAIKPKNLGDKQVLKDLIIFLNHSNDSLNNEESKNKITKVNFDIAT